MLNLSNRLLTSNYTDETIHKLKVVLEKCPSEKTQSVASKALAELKANRESVQSFDRIVKQVPRCLQGVVGFFLSIFLSSRYLVQNEETQKRYEQELQVKLRKAAKEEVRDLARTMINEALKSHRAKGKCNTVESILTAEMVHSFFDKASSSTWIFDPDDQMKIRLEALQHEFKPHIKGHVSLEFHLKQIVSQIQYEKLFRAFPKEGAPPAFYMKLETMPATTRQYLEVRLQQQHKATSALVKNIIKRATTQPSYAKSLSEQEKKLEHITSQMEQLDNPNSKGVFRVDLRSWDELNVCFGGDVPQHVLDIDENRSLRESIALREQALQDICHTSSTLIPFSDPSELENAAIPIFVKKAAIKAYFESIQHPHQKKLCLAQSNHILCLARWLKDQDSSSELASDMQKHVQKQISKVHVSKMFQSSHVGQKERDLIYLAQIMIHYDDQEILDRHLDPGIQKLIAEYTLALVKNPKHAKRLANLSQNTMLSEFDPSEYQKYVKTLTYKFKCLLDPKTCEKTISKVQNTLEKSNRGELVDSSDKISLSELGTLEDMKKVYDYLLQLKMDNYRDQEPELDRVLNIVSVGKQLYETIESLAQDQAAQLYPSGSIALTDFDRQIAYRRFAPNFEENLTYLFVSKFTHAAKIYRKSEEGAEGIHISHIYGTYENNSVSLRDIITNNYYKVDLKRLVKPDLLSLIEERAPEGFWEQAQEEYEDIERQIHDDHQKNFEMLRNSEQVRFQAGYAKYGFVAKNLTGQEDDRMKKIRDEIFQQGNFPQGSTMICSDFASRTTSAALYQLDEWLQSQLQKEGIAFNLDNTGMGVLQIPIHPMRRYETIHPEEIVLLYNKPQAIQRLPYPPIIRDLIHGLN